MSDTDDIKVIQKILSGDVNSFEVLLNKYRDRIFRYVMNYIGNYEDAMELTQDILFAVYKSLPSFRGESKFSTWLYSITANHCKNYKKKAIKLKKVPLFVVDEYGNENELSIADDNQNIEDNIIAKETMNIAMEELHKLPSDYKEIIILRDIEDYSYEEIAEILGIGLSNVKVRIHRGREMLTRCLSQRGVL